MKIQVMYDDDDDDWDKKSLRRFMKPNFKKHISKLTLFDPIEFIVWDIKIYHIRLQRYRHYQKIRIYGKASIS